MSAGPLLVIVDRIDGQPDDFHAALVEFRLELGHGAELGGADRGKILGVREQHDPIIADPIMEADLAFRRFGFEIRGGIAYLECHCKPPSCRTDPRCLGDILFVLHGVEEAAILGFLLRIIRLNCAVNLEELSRRFIRRWKKFPRLSPAAGDPLTGMNAAAVHQCLKGISCFCPHFALSRPFGGQPHFPFSF